MDKDIFLCHASEDKNQVVRPLFEAFTKAEISCWYDEAEIKWGDSITQKVNEGLKISRYVIVVLSTAFMQKNWPQREFNAMLNQEASTGKVRVLPLLVGNDNEKKKILNQYPLLGDKLYLPWNGNIDDVVKAMQSRLGRSEQSIQTKTDRSLLEPQIPLPRIRKRFTEHDKDAFLREAYNTVKRYFNKGFEQFETQFYESEYELLEINPWKFTAKIYFDDHDIRCKIWIGGIGSSNDAIAYSSDIFDINNDNSLNDMLSVDNDDQRLFLRPMGIWIGAGEFTPKDQLLPKKQRNTYGAASSNR